MTDRDPLLTSALNTLVPSFEDAAPDWADALRRGHRSRRRRLALSAMALAPIVVALLVAPAFGFGRSVLPFFGAEKAPQPVVHDFASMSTGAPPGMDPAVIASETRKVGVWHFGGKAHTLWVAPTRAGGFCDLWTDGGGGCDREGTVPVDAVGAMAPMRVVPGEDTQARLENGIPVWIAGYVRSKYAAAAEIRFEDGTVVRPELTWVSEPIGAGFFAYDIPAAQRAIGHRAVSVVAVNADGEHVATDYLGVGGLRDPLADAVVAERHLEVEVETTHGTATLYTAPTRYDGRCAFAEFEGKRVSVYPCLPARYGFDNLALRIIPTLDAVLIAGALPEKVATVELGFADGDNVTLHAHGYLLYEVPAGHLVPSAMLTRIVERDASGGHVGPPSPPFGRPAEQPCYRPLPLPPGTHCPGGF